MKHDKPIERLIGLSNDELAAADVAVVDTRMDPADVGARSDLHIGDYAKPDVPTAEAIHAMPLKELPILLRRIGELEASLRWEWWTAYRHYRLCLARWINHYREHDRLGITAAQYKAEADDDVINPMVESRNRWEAWQTARRARLNVKAELRVRTSSNQRE